MRIAGTMLLSLLLCAPLRAQIPPAGDTQLNIPKVQPIGGHGLTLPNRAHQQMMAERIGSYVVELQAPQDWSAAAEMVGRLLGLILLILIVKGVIGFIRRRNQRKGSGQK